MLTSIEKIDALMAGLTRADIERMPPAHRQRLAQVLRHIAHLAEAAGPSPDRRSVATRYGPLA
jgi:hypothetical protein